MATATAVPEQQQPQMSGIARAFNVLFSPKATFEDIARKPGWVMPIVLLTVLSIGVGVLISKKVDWTSFIRQQNEKSARFQNLPEDQKERSIEVGAKIAPTIGWCIAIIGPIFFTLILAVIYQLAFNVISGAGLKFPYSFGAAAHASMPGIFTAILTMVVLSMKNYGDVNPQTMLASNLAAFLPGDSAPWMISLGTSLDIFWIWTLVLFAIGFRAGNPRKISGGAAAGIVFGLWAIWVVVKTGWAAMM